MQRLCPAPPWRSSPFFDNFSNSTAEEQQAFLRSINVASVLVVRAAEQHCFATPTRVVRPRSTSVEVLDTPPRPGACSRRVAARGLSRDGLSDDTQQSGNYGPASRTGAGNEVSTKYTPYVVKPDETIVALVASFALADKEAGAAELFGQGAVEPKRQRALAAASV